MHFYITTIADATMVVVVCKAIEGHTTSITMISIIPLRLRTTPTAADGGLVLVGSHDSLALSVGFYRFLPAKSASRVLDALDHRITLRMSSGRESTFGVPDAPSPPVELVACW